MPQPYSSLRTDEAETTDSAPNDERDRPDMTSVGLPANGARWPSFPHAWSQSTDFKAFGTYPSTVSKHLAMSQRARILRVLLFLLLETIWLGFGLIANSRIIETPSGGEPVVIAGVPTSHDALFKSGLSALGNIWQMVLLLFVGDIVKETFSSEWAHMLSLADGRVMHDTDRVSTLTSGYIDQATHTFDRRSSCRYQFAFSIALLSFVLQSIAPGAVSVASDTASTPSPLTIGALRANSTFPTVPPLSLGSTGDTIGDFDPKTVLARKLPLKATRFVYNAKAEHSTPEFQIDSNNTLFGMPPRSMLSQHLSYRSDAVFYNFECRWVAPTFVGKEFSILDSTWSFGGDSMGTLDYNAQADVNAQVPQWLFGLWPLMIQSGPGASNGSFAWLVFGSDASHPIDLSSILASDKTYNESGWFDLVENIKATSAGHAADFGVYSSWASVLFCDPNVQFGTVEVELKEQILSHRRIEDDEAAQPRRIGNIDETEAALMVGRSLNGITWDSIRTGIGAPFDSDSDLSRLAFEFSLLQSEDPNSSAVIPQALTNISLSVGSYTAVAGSSAYLDGTVGTLDVTAQTIRDIQRLVCSWPQWGASAGIVLLIAFLLIIIIVLERSGTEPVIPLTVTMVTYALKEGRLRSKDEGETYEREPFNPELLYKTYSTNGMSRP